jgi:hypothetical protein
MKTIIISVVLLISLNIVFSEDVEKLNACGCVVFDQTVEVKAGKYNYKVIKIDWSDFTAYKDYAPSRCMLVGKLYVIGSHNTNFDIACYILTPDQYETFVGGDTPSTAVFWQTRDDHITIRDVELDLGSKYYLVLDNRHSKITDKKILLYILALPI